LEVKRKFNLRAFGIDSEGNKVAPKPVHGETNKKKHPDCTVGRHNARTPTVERYNLIVKLLTLKQDGKEEELNTMIKEVGTKTYQSMNDFYLDDCIDPETHQRIVELHWLEGEEEIEVEEDDDELATSPSSGPTIKKYKRNFGRIVTNELQVFDALVQHHRHMGSRSMYDQLKEHYYNITREHCKLFTQLCTSCEDAPKKKKKKIKGAKMGTTSVRYRDRMLIDLINF
jgi:hypothetical protein